MTCSGMRAYGNGMRLASVWNQGAVLVARYRKTIVGRPARRLSTQSYIVPLPNTYT